MDEKNLAIIMAAGYGTRMGSIGIPKVMLLDSHGKPLIDDALSFLKYSDGHIDFAVLSRDEKFFSPLNDYLRKHPVSDQFKVLHQRVKPKNFHVMALFQEYFFNQGDVRQMLGEYENIIVLPADHKLTSEDLNLEELVLAHQDKGANITLVFSEGWGHNPNFGEIVRTGEDGRISYLKRVDPATYQDKENFKRVTNTGVWVITRNLFDNPFRLAAAYAGFTMGIGVTARVASAYAYMIRQGWSGLRDTPLDIQRW